MVNIALAKEKCIKFNLRARTMLSIIEKYEAGQITALEARTQAKTIITDLKAMLNQAQTALT